MEQIPLSVTRREGTGKGHARKLRAAGFIPAVIYSAGREAENVSVAIRDLEKVLRQISGLTAFLSLKLDQSQPRLAVIREIQTDYLGKKPVHLDFYEVKADQELTMDVPVELVGTPKGADDGGVLDTQSYTVSVQGTVATIPERLELDISRMEIGDTIHAANLTLPEGVSLITDESVVIVSCYIPAAAEEGLGEELGEGEEGEGEEGAEGEDKSEGGEEGE